MTDRRSFFERLTGTVRVAEEQGEAVEVAVPTHEERDERPVAPPSPDDAEGQLTVDVYQTPDTMVIKSTIAGVRPEDLDVSITNDMVTIRGMRHHDEETKDDDYFYRECYWGNFSRSIILPVDIIAEKADASLKDGILTIRIPKSDALVTKKVKVRGF
jgi:HSP20 family protein